MPLPNGNIGVVNNPLINSPFIQNTQFRIIIPPVTGEGMITETSIIMITESGNVMVTE